MDLKRIADEAKNDVVETYYGNGQLWSRANYKDGNLDGLCEEWSRDGKLRSRANYKNGKRDGLREFWYDNGQQWLRETYKDGNRDGLCNEWDEKGNLVESAMYKDDVSNNINAKQSLKLIDLYQQSKEEINQKAKYYFKQTTTDGQGFVTFDAYAEQQLQVNQASLQLQADLLATKQALSKAEVALAEAKRKVPFSPSAIIAAKNEIKSLEAGLKDLEELQEELF